MKSYRACLSTARFYYLPIFQIELFGGEKLFFATRGCFLLRLKFSRSTIIAAKTSQAPVELKLEVM